MTYVVIEISIRRTSRTVYSNVVSKTGSNVTICILYFLTMFSLGGATGVILGSASIVLSLHDTYYIISHFHIVLALGSLLGLFSGTILFSDITIGNQGCQSLNLVLPTSTSLILMLWMYLRNYGISLSFL